MLERSLIRKDMLERSLIRKDMLERSLRLPWNKHHAACMLSCAFPYYGAPRSAISELPPSQSQNLHRPLARGLKLERPHMGMHACIWECMHMGRQARETPAATSACLP